MMTAANAKLAALTATPMTGLPVSSNRPPMAGPTTITRFSSVAKIEFAAARSFSPTTSGVSAPAAGRYGTIATADRADEGQDEADGASDRDHDRDAGHERRAGQGGDDEDGHPLVAVREHAAVAGQQQAGSPAAEAQDSQPLGRVGAVEDVHRDHDEARPVADLVDQERGDEQPQVTVPQRVTIASARRGRAGLAPSRGRGDRPVPSYRFFPGRWRHRLGSYPRFRALDGVGAIQQRQAAQAAWSAADTSRHQTLPRSNAGTADALGPPSRSSMTRRCAPI